MCYGLRASVFEEFLALGDFHKNGPSTAVFFLPVSYNPLHSQRDPHRPPCKP